MATDNVEFQQRGAIVRIKIRNFMTYEETEISPGPNLNMILGPNGTGKSAVVCCIIVGLAGEVGLTGRGGSPADFVNKNSDWGSTYIELFNNKGPNYTVERKITITNRTKFKLDHKSEWRINDKPCLKAEVQKLTKKLNIKVDNLCQFLPQDSVTQFVKMNTQELLLNTLKAAGDNQLVEDHQKLVALTEEVRSNRSEYRNLEDMCKENEVNVQRLESEVHLLRQRDELIKEKSICGEKIYFAKYQEAKSRRDEAKASSDTLIKELGVIESQSEPFQRDVDSYKDKLSKAKDAFKATAEKMRSALGLTENVKAAIEERKFECQTEYSKFREKKLEEDKRESAIRLKQQELDTYEAKLHDLRDVDCSRQIAQVGADLSEAKGKQEEFQKKKRDLDDQLRLILMSLNNEEEEKKQIHNLMEKKLQLLKTISPDSHTIVNWYSKNQDKFKHKIFPPLMCQINVKEQKYSRFVESAIPRAELTAFVCQSKEDLLTFTRLVRDQLKISFNVILAPDKSMSAKFIDEASRLPDLGRYGVKAYLKDLIDAPEPIMRYLCGSYNFHRIPVADMCSEADLKQLLTHCPRFYANNQYYTVNRSRYDNQKIVIQDTTRDAHLLIYSFDKQRSDQCDKKLNDLRAAREKANQARDNSLAELDSWKEKWQEFKDKQTALLNKQNERTRLETFVKVNREQLERLRSDRIDIAVERVKLQKSIEKINLTTVGCLKDLSEIYKSLTKASRMTKTNLLLVKIASFNHKLAVKKLAAAQSDTTRLRSKIKSKQQEVAVLNSQLNTASAMAEEKIKGFRADGTLSRATQTRFNSISEATVEELTSKLSDLSLQIQRIYQDANNTVLNEFNRLSEELKDKRFKLTELRSSIEKIDSELETIKKNWLPKLQEVIASINFNYKEFMKKLHYGGEVRLNFDQQDQNNFASYGILILVKYRDSESLIPLSSTRQSGGERSVATMIYMLALQAKTSVPFRCVDEINQGMDKENERKVFELLVSTADSSSSQYFLVSPKLLSNLPYSEKMMIHVVFNGPTLGSSWKHILADL